MNATATRKPRQRRSHQRSVKVLVAPAAGNPLMFVRITQDGKACYYWISPLASDFGRGFRFEKPEIGGETYDVLLEPTGDSCTCKGHSYGGYCKHVDAARALIGAGKLS
jgi:hypothetical protein